jgi:hypothetical protein
VRRWAGRACVANGIGVHSHSAREDCLEANGWKRDLDNEHKKFFGNLALGATLKINRVAQKEEWQTLNHFGGSSVCLASRRFMRSGYFIVDLIRLHNNADTVDRIRIFLYMPSRAGPVMYEPRVPISIRKTDKGRLSVCLLRRATAFAVFLCSFVREIRREAVTHNTSHFVRWDRGAPWFRTAPIQLVPLRFGI